MQFSLDKNSFIIAEKHINTNESKAAASCDNLRECDVNGTITDGGELTERRYGKTAKSKCRGKS